MSKIGPHSRPDKLQVVDGRRAEAKLMKRHREELIAHVGGNPSATQAVLIEQAVALVLRLRLLDKEALVAGSMSDRNGRQYLAWANSLARLMRQLGQKPAAKRQPSLAEHLAARSTSKPEAHT